MSNHGVPDGLGGYPPRPCDTPGDLAAGLGGYPPSPFAITGGLAVSLGGYPPNTSAVRHHDNVSLMLRILGKMKRTK